MSIMKITILGCGTSTGVPMVGCACPVCSSSDPKDKRTRSSLLITYENRNILIDTTPDLRRQALRESLTRIDAVLFTHPHADHINGIDDLRGFHFLHREVIPCYCSRATMEILLAGFNYIFNHIPGSGYVPLLQHAVVSGPFELFGLKVIPLPLEHGKTESLGYRIGPFAYLTDCNGVPEDTLKLLDGIQVLVIDGLRWTPHPFHFNIAGAVESARQLSPERIILTHLSHEVSFSDGVKLPWPAEFAFDGMTLELPAALWN